MPEQNDQTMVVYAPQNREEANQAEIVEFFYKHLDEYGDTRESIQNAITYALSTEPNKGGYVIVGKDGDTITGSVILNLTHMEGYHPPNYLVYIAVNRRYRGKGIGKTLAQKSIDITEGGIALHVEAENPARFLYEKLGFKNKYLEYRLSK